MKIVTYYRISKKGTGLGLEAQADYCQTAIKQQGWKEVASFTDDGVSGSLRNRPALDKAVAYCLKHGCTLMAAKVDRLHRDTEHLSALIKQVDVKIATMPQAEKFQLQLFAALAEQERDFIVSRTKDALNRLKARAEAGDTEAQAKIANRTANLMPVREQGTAASAKARNAMAADYLKTVEDAFLAGKAKGYTSVRQLAAYMNERGFKTINGKEWTSSTVQRISKQLTA